MKKWKLWKRNKYALYTDFDPKKFEKELKKGDRFWLRKAIAGTLVFLSTITCQIAYKNATIQEASNVKNAYAMIHYLGQDTNEDGILELSTPLLSYIQTYSEPTEDTFFNNSNFLYKWSDTITISDNISFQIAANRLKQDIIEIDNELYSKTGYITRIRYVENGEPHTKFTSIVFNDEKEILQYLRSISDTYFLYDRFILETTVSKVKTFEEIPTIKKNKESGVVSLEEPSPTITKIKKKILNDRF